MPELGAVHPQIVGKRFLAIARRLSAGLNGLSKLEQGSVVHPQIFGDAVFSLYSIYGSILDALTLGARQR